MNITITGGAGFIGCNLIEKLITTNKIICVDNFNDHLYDSKIKRDNIQPFFNNKNFILIEEDIRNIELLKKIEETNLNIDKIIHLAALAGVRDSFKNEMEYLDVNVSGTINMLRIAKELNISRFLFASSSSVYGNKEGEMKENDNINPISPYAYSKAVGEDICKNIDKNFDVVCMRFFSVVGKGQRPDLLFSNIEKAIKENKELVVYGDGTKMRDWTDVDFVVESIEKLMCCKLKNMCEIINIGTGNPITVNEAIENISLNLGKRPKIIYKNDAVGDVYSTFANTEKLKIFLKNENS